jgi:hypothetical protein
MAYRCGFILAVDHDQVVGPPGGELL